jgi:chromosome segregation ATPase
MQEDLAAGRTQLNQANATIAEQAWQLETTTTGTDRQTTSLAGDLSSATSQLRSTQAQLADITAHADELRSKCQRCEEERERLAGLHSECSSRGDTAEALVSELQVRISNRLLKAIWRART